MQVDPIPERAERAAEILLDAAFQVHRTLGPGLLENVYEVCLCHELHKRGLPFQRQVALPIVYDAVRLDTGVRLDLVIDDVLVVELKTVEKIIPLHEAQLLTYLKLAEKRLGLLINFNVPLLKDGIHRIVL